MSVKLVLYYLALSSLNYLTEQKFIQNDANNATTTTILHTTNYKTETKEAHLNLWLKDLLGKLENKTKAENIDTNLSLNEESYVEVPIYKDKGNDIKLTTQLDLLQSQGTHMKEILQGVDNKQGVIKLKKISYILLNDTSKEDKMVDKENEFNEYTWDLNKGIGIMESSNVHKVINSTLLTNKVAIPTIEHNKSVAVRNTSSWVNDNLPSETMAQIEANTLRTTGIPLSTLTAVSSDIHLLQGNNIYKQSNQTADQVMATTQKNLLIEKLLTPVNLAEMSNSNLNITNVNQQNAAGNYMQVDPGKSNNCVTDLKQILQMIQPLEHMNRPPQVPPTLNGQFYTISKEIESDFENWQPQTFGRILHTDIGININCVVHQNTNTPQ